MASKNLEEAKNDTQQPEIGSKKGIKKTARLLSPKYRIIPPDVTCRLQITLLRM